MLFDTEALRSDLYTIFCALLVFLLLPLVMIGISSALGLFLVGVFDERDITNKPFSPVQMW